MHRANRRSGARMDEATTTRREFLKACAAAGVAVPTIAAAASLCVAGTGEAADGALPKRGRIGKLVEARYYMPLDGGRVQCMLCPLACEIEPGERGDCGVRENRDGTCYTLVYGNPCSGYDGGMPDPIEKKPLFHFLPGTRAYSIACAGCNVRCKFCQNWQISQARPEETLNFDLPPAAVVANARKHRCRSIAFTYSEPTVFYEYMYDTAKLGRESKVHSVMISNGYISAAPMEALCEQLSAVKIDLKAFTDEFYRKVVGGSLKPVLNTLKLLKEKGAWFEIVYLIIPTLNDNLADIRSMSKWIAGELGPMVPVHFTAFYPTYKLRNLPRTPVASLEAARSTAMAEGLKYVYVGNVWTRGGHEGESTWCHNCGKRIIYRSGYRIREIHLTDGACEYCGTHVPGVWKD